MKEQASTCYDSSVVAEEKSQSQWRKKEGNPNRKPPIAATLVRQTTKATLYERSFLSKVLSSD